MRKFSLFGAKQWVSLVILGLIVALAIVTVIVLRGNITGSASVAYTSTPTATPTPSCPTANNFFEPSELLDRQDLAAVFYQTDPSRFNYCPTTPTFKDMLIGNRDYCKIEGLYRAGVIKPCDKYATGTYFCPNDPADRATLAQFGALLVAGGESNIPAGPATPSFTDVPKTHWAYRYIEYGKANGFLNGFGDGTFRPAVQVDRATTAVVLSRIKGKSLNRVTPTFSDVPQSFWAYKEIEGVNAAGYMKGWCRQATLALSPNSGTFKVGYTVNIDIVLDTRLGVTGGVDAIITYDNTVLEVQDADPNTAGTQIKPGDIFPQFFSKVENGKISAVAIDNPTSAGYIGRGKVGTITFKVLKVASPSNVSFVFTPGGTNDSNVSELYTANDILRAVTNGSYILQPADVSLSLYPASGNYNPGQVFNTDIVLDTGGKSAVGTDAVLTYDPTKLQVLDSDTSKSGVQVKPGNIFQNYILNTVSNGKIQVSGIITPGGPEYKGKGTFATITFKALSLGMGNKVNFAFTPGSTTDSNVAGSNGSDMLTWVVNGWYNITNTTPSSSPSFTPTPLVTPSISY